MASYTVDPAVLLPYLPGAVELDLYQGQAYVSLVGFMFKNSRIFGLPVPFFGNFEEINLRFYVKRKEGSENRRGVVFIRETVPNQLVAWMANVLYREHYIAIPTRHQWEITDTDKKIQYDWKINQRWNHLSVHSGIQGRPMLPGSKEEFTFEHYYGYTKISSHQTEEYYIRHPRWLVHDVNSYKIDCDFEGNYGKNFRFLQDQTPVSVMLAEGSAISVKWKRRKINS